LLTAHRPDQPDDRAQLTEDVPADRANLFDTEHQLGYAGSAVETDFAPVIASRS
jgi:hypothetical protein